MNGVGPRVPQKSRRFAALGACVPRARVVVVGTLLGAIPTALVHALVIAIRVPMPRAGVALRLLHHACAALETAGVFAALAVVPAAACVAASRWPVLGGSAGRFAAWLAAAIGAGFAMFGLVGADLERQAHAALDGRLAGSLLPLYATLVGMAVPAAYVLGNTLARAGKAWQRSGVALAAVLVVGHHLVLRDDYPGVHAAAAWAGAALFGASYAGRVTRWLARATNHVPRCLDFAAATALLVALLVTPSNAVRLELFREPGAAASWALARTVWRAPSLGAPFRGAEPSRCSSLAPSRVGAHVAASPTVSAEPPRPRVVVLVTVDALRADVVASGAHDARFPNLVRMRDGGAYFSRAVAPGSQTSVSLAAMFSGRYFSQLAWEPHGVGMARFLYPAHDDTARFPALLGAAHVRTESFVGLQFLAGSYGVARGFERERVLVEGRAHARAEALMRPLVSAVARQSDEPAFYYVHLTEPHEPYDRGAAKEGTPFERYLSEIEVVDAWLGKLSRALSHRRDGVLFVTADHGEAFGEHGTVFHTKTLYDELLRVPLIAFGVGIARGRHEALVGLVDLGPTVLELFGGGAVSDGTMGRSLVPYLRGEPGHGDRVLFAEGRLRRAMFREDGLKVIEDAVRKTVEVFDLTRDPGELDNLFDRERARVVPAVAQLRACFAELAPPRPGYEPPYKP